MRDLKMKTLFSILAITALFLYSFSAYADNQSILKITDVSFKKNADQYSQTELREDPEIVIAITKIGESESGVVYIDTLTFSQLIPMALCNDIAPSGDIQDFVGIEFTGNSLNVKESLKQYMDSCKIVSDYARSKTSIFLDKVAGSLIKLRCPRLMQEEFDANYKRILNNMTLFPQEFAQELNKLVLEKSSGAMRLSKPKTESQFSKYTPGPGVYLTLIKDGDEIAEFYFAANDSTNSIMGWPIEQ